MNGRTFNLFSADSLEPLAYETSVQDLLGVTEMDAQGIRRRVLEEVGDCGANRFGWDFRDCVLAEPRIARYSDGRGTESEFWCVFQEPSDGYHIVYDEELQVYAIATSNVAVSWFDSFLGAVEAL